MTNRTLKQVIGATLAISLAAGAFGYACKKEKESQLAEFAGFQNQSTNALNLLSKGDDISAVNAYNTARETKSRLKSLRISRARNNDLDFLNGKAVDQVYTTCDFIMSNAESRLEYIPVR